MQKRLNIKTAAKERGITLSSIAKRLKMARSNISAIAGGARGVSLDKLRRIADILGCGIDELVAPKEQHIFKDRRLESLLASIEERNFDGVDKSWVTRVMFARNLHFKTGRKTTKA